jgi:hypothetical protein
VAASVLLLGLVAGGMVLVNTTIFLEFFPRDGSRPTVARAFLVCFFLLATAVFWGCLLFALLRPSLVGLMVAVLGMNVLAMTPLVWASVRLWKNGSNLIDRSSRRWPGLLAGSLTTGEALMGAVFVVAQGGARGFTTGGPLAVGSEVGAAATSPWFFWGMLGAMVPLLFWVPLPTNERNLLLGLNATSAVGPLVVPAPWIGALGMSLIMGVTLLLLVREMGWGPTGTPTYIRTGFGVVGGLAVMNVAELASIALASPWGRFAFGSAAIAMMVAEMVLLTPRLLREYR